MGKIIKKLSNFSLIKKLIISYILIIMLPIVSIFFLSYDQTLKKLRTSITIY